MFIGRTDTEAETPILWPPHVKSWLIGKDPDAGRDWGQEEKGTREDEMAGWHHQLYAYEFRWTPGVGDGHRGLMCCDPWGHKESDTTEQLNWIELIGWSFGNMFSQFLFAWTFSWKIFSGYKFLDWKLYLHIYAKPRTLTKSNLVWMWGNRNSYSFLMQIQNDMVTLENNLAYYIYIYKITLL